MIQNRSLSDICNVAYAMTIVGGKWKISIIWELAGGPLRLSALRRKLLGIAEGVLITQLKQLEKDKLIKRIVYKEIPPHVEYQLTKDGHLLVDSIQQLEQWGDTYRKRYTRATAQSRKTS